MIQTIRCYPLDPSVTVEVQSFRLPLGSKFLSVKPTNDALCLYVLEDEETTLMERREIRLFLTDQNIEHGNLAFIDTVPLSQTMYGGFAYDRVLHIFEQMS